jgi:hypothetical protein
MRPADDVVGEALEGEMVLLNLRTGIYFGLNRTGTRAWELLGSGAELATVCETLLQELDVDAATLGRDLSQLFEQLLEHHLVVEC